MHIKKKRQKPNVFGWKCFLDSWNPPSDPSWICFNSIEEAINYSNIYGEPYEISLDLESLENLNIYAFLNHLKEKIHPKGYELPKINTHSGSAEEKEKLMNYILNWNKTK